METLSRLIFWNCGEEYKFLSDSETYFWLESNNWRQFIDV